MSQRELARKAKLKMLEQLPSGEYVARYGFREECGAIRYMSSQYPRKPTLEQIHRSFHRFMVSLTDDELKDVIYQGFSLSDYSIIE